MDYTEKTVRDNYKALTQLLIEKNINVSTMESITAGMISSLITDTEGSSAVLKGAFVTYSNQAKIMQGVNSEVIQRYGVYSKETAAEMAQSAKRAYGADIGIGITGTAGNADCENADSVPGEVYFALAYDNEVRTFEVKLQPCAERYIYKMNAAGRVCEELLLWLK